MRKIPSEKRGKTIKQIDALVFHRLVPEHHVPVLRYIRTKIENDEPFEIDGHIILSAYKQFLRGVHLKEMNKNHPSHRTGKGKGKKDKSFYKSAEYREKLRKAQMGRKDSPETIAKRAAKVKASWEAKRAAKEKS